MIKKCTFNTAAVAAWSLTTVRQNQSSERRPTDKHANYQLEAVIHFGTRCCSSQSVSRLAKFFVRQGRANSEQAQTQTVAHPGAKAKCGQPIC